MVEQTTTRYDVFVSYRWVEPDLTWVRDHFFPALQRSGLKVCLDVEDFIPGRNLYLEMTRAQGQSKRVLCVVSPDYAIEDSVSSFEALRARQADPSGAHSRLIPLVLRPTPLPDWFRDLVPIQWDRPHERPQQWRKLLQLLGATHLDSDPPPGADEIVVPVSPPSLPDAEKLDGVLMPGVRSRETVFEAEPAPPGQVFAAELLTQQIVFKKRPDGGVRVTINRDGVTHGVFTTEGKTALCRRYLGSEEQRATARLREHAAHRALLGEFSTVVKTSLTDLPVRWASGGVLAVVAWKGRTWTPFFFRDIPPYGWNLPLGAARRGDDLNNPWTFLLREFLEEVLVLEGDPMEPRVRCRRFGFDYLKDEKERAKAREFIDRHCQLRYRDGMELEYVDAPEESEYDESSTIPVDFAKTATEINVIHRGTSHTHRNVVVAINLLELGIEVLKVVEFTLGPEDYILDGEILSLETGPELVRMPAALIDHAYLRRVFGARDAVLAYEGDTQPSVRAAPIEPDEIHIFPQDALRRREIACGLEPAAREWEKIRYSEWLKQFGSAFFDADGNVTSARASTLFTPASAKALTYYFASTRP